MGTNRSINAGPSTGTTALELPSFQEIIRGLERVLISAPYYTLYGFRPKGVVIFVDKAVPLHVSIDDSGSSSSSRICLQALPHSLNCIPGASSVAVLRYTVCGFKNISTAVQFFFSESTGVNATGQGEPPSLELLERPIWSVQDSLSDGWTQDDLVEFTTNITANGFPISRLELGRGYTDDNGALLFSEDRFHDVSQMLAGLKALGINNISATVSPFINYDSSVFLRVCSQ